MSDNLEEQVKAYLASKTDEQKSELNEQYCNSGSVPCDYKNYDHAFKDLVDKFQDLLVIESFTKQDSLKSTKNKKETLKKMLNDFNELVDLREKNKEMFYIIFVSSEALTNRSDRILIKITNEDTEYFIDFEDYFKDEEYTNSYIEFYLLVSPSVALYYVDDEKKDGDDKDDS